jgi:prepilin-type N-terminal cleavage/methylation domain-containing protein
MKKMRTGFTMIELLGVLAIIGIIATLGYPFIAKAMMKAKAQKVVEELKEIQKSIGDAVRIAGGYYQSTGTANSSLGVASPQSVPTPQEGVTCGYSPSGQVPSNITIEYLDNGTPKLDTTCHGQSIEKVLHDSLTAIGMKWVSSTHDFRLPSAPLAHISFPFEVNGIRTIRIWGIQGDLAFHVFQALNGTKAFSRGDGWKPDRPVALAKFVNSSSAATGGGKYGAGTETNCLQMLDELDTVEKSFNCIVTGQNIADHTQDAGGNTFYKPGEEDKAKNAPKVVLYYTYAFGYDDEYNSNESDLGGNSGSTGSGTSNF